jgi:hypothetical protein
MRQFLPDPLTREEFAALKQIDDAGKPGTIPAKIRERLILVGYVKEVLAGLIVTDEGMLRIVLDNDHGAGG